MYEIERRFKNRPGTYPVYSQEEADEEGVAYEVWYDVGEGQWGLTDDGYVMMCHRIYNLGCPGEGSQFGRQFVYTVGRPICNFSTRDWSLVGSPVFLFLPYLKTGGFQYSVPQTWQEAEVKQRRTKDAVALYAQMFLLRQGRLREADWDQIGRVYRPDQECPRKTVRRLFKEEEVRDMAARKIREILVGAGMTEEEVVGMYRDLFEHSIEANHTSTALETLRDLRDMMDLKPQEVEVSMEEESYSFAEVFGQIERAQEPKEVPPRRDPEQLATRLDDPQESTTIE